MSKRFPVSRQDFVQQLKFSGQVPSLLEGIVQRQVIATAAQQANLAIAPAELQQAADQLRSQNNLWTAEETWAWLQTHHLSIDDFELMARDRLLQDKLKHHLFDNAIEPFFAEHQLDYVQVVLYEVMLENADLALELYYALQEQETTFPDIAHRYILDPELRRQGGYRGILRRGDLRPEISAAVFAAEPPQVLRPIIINRQSYLIWVEEIIQPQLDKELRSQIMTELFHSWLKRQIAETMEWVRVELD